jgi:poly(3-hydroxybutyrate) depolymerase
MPSLSSEVQDATMRVGDRERSYLVYVPASLPSGAALLIVLHGCRAKVVGGDSLDVL